MQPSARRKIDSLVGLQVEVMSLSGVACSRPTYGRLVEVTEVGVLIAESPTGRLVFSSNITFRVLEDSTSEKR